MIIFNHGGSSREGWELDTYSKRVIISMNLKQVSFIAGSILIISFLAYYLLGGFQDIQISVEPGKSYRIAGKDYSGKNNSRELEKLFVEARQFVQANKSSTTLVIVNDESKYDAEENIVSYFIGALLKNSDTSIKEDYSIKEYESGKVIRVLIDAHNLVMPKAEKIRRKALRLAQSEGLELSDLTIEKYLEEGRIEIDFLLKG